MWIMVTGITQVFVLLGLVLAACTDWEVRPHGLHIVMFLIYFGSSTGSISQALAFTPHDDLSVGRFFTKFSLGKNANANPNPKDNRQPAHSVVLHPVALEYLD